MWFSFLSLFMLSFVFAQEQLVLRINEQGFMKVLEMALKYNTSGTLARTVLVPENLYKFTLKQKDLAKNPVVQVMGEISDLNLNKDLDFYLKTSEIKITGVVLPNSLTTKIVNSSASGFDINVGLKFSQLTVKADGLSLCENKIVKTKKCGNGLKTTATGLSIQTKDRPVNLNLKLRLSIKNAQAKVKVISVDSNLDSQNAPRLDINFKSLSVPRIAIVIDGQETELDTSRLRDEILERKGFLGKKLLSFVADFVANDLSDMINIYLGHTSLPTSIRVFERKRENFYNELKSNDTNIEIPSYHRNQVTFSDISTDDRWRHQVAVRDNTYVKPPVQLIYRPKPAKDVMKILLEQFAEVIKHAQVDISLKALSTPGNKDFELSGVLGFILNHTSFSVGNNLGNSQRTLPKIDLSSRRSNDINLAISEPVINGALDLVNSTGLFSEILDEITDLDALSLNNLKLHFTHSQSLAAVANVAIDLKKMRTSFWSNPKAWIETEIGIWLERNNNNSVIYFPIEIEVTPIVERNPQTNEAQLSLTLKSVFDGDGLRNTFKYPSNVGSMYQIVRKAVLKKLHEQMDQYAGKVFKVDLSKFLNQSGVVFSPRSIIFDQAAYLLMNLDISDIKFDALNQSKR